MKTKKLLKILIALEIATGLISTISDHFLKSYLPDEIRQYILRTDTAELTSIQIWGLIFGTPLFVCKIIGWIGLSEIAGTAPIY